MKTRILAVVAAVAVFGSWATVHNFNHQPQKVWVSVMDRDPKKDTPAPAPFKATTPDPSGSRTNDAQDFNPAADAAFRLKMDAQLTAIPIVALADLMDKVFGNFSNQDDLTNGQLDWTPVAVSGFLYLGHVGEEAPRGAKVFIDYDKDGRQPLASIQLRTGDAFKFREVEERTAAGEDVSNLPAEDNATRIVYTSVGSDSIAAVQGLHDGDPLILVGQFSVGAGNIMLNDAHVPPPDEVKGNQVIFSRPISVRDLHKDWTW